MPDPIINTVLIVEFSAFKSGLEKDFGDPGYKDFWYLASRPDGINQAKNLLPSAAKSEAFFFSVRVIADSSAWAKAINSPSKINEKAFSYTELVRVENSTHWQARETIAIKKIYQPNIQVASSIAPNIMAENGNWKGNSIIDIGFSAKAEDITVGDPSWDGKKFNQVKIIC